MKRRNNRLITNSTPLAVEPPKQMTFDEAVKSFMLHCRAKNFTVTSLDTYKYGLLSFKKAFQKQELPLNLPSITAKQIKENFIGYLLEDGMASHTVNGRIRTCKVFFRYLHTENIITDNIADQFNLIIAEKQMIQTLTKEQIVLLLNQPDCNSFTGLRDYTIMILLLETGMRITECMNLELDDINLKDQEIHIRLGKGRKSRRVPIQKTCIRALKKYLEERGNADTNALFINIDGGPVHKRTIQENIQTYGKIAQITGVRVSPHTFRHTMAKFYILNGGDIFTLQKILGHSTLDMVRYYLEFFGTDINEQHKKYSPVENMMKNRFIR